MRETSTAAARARRRTGRRLRLAAALAAVVLTGVGCSSSGSSHGSSSSASPGTSAPSSSSPAGSGSAAPSAAAAVQPLTDTGSKDSADYFVDPYPIHTAPTNDLGHPYFSGTTKRLLSCVTDPPAHCTNEEQTKVTPGPALKKAAGRYGSRTTTVINSNAYQMDSGAWQMAATMYVKNPAHPSGDPWTVIVHAHPQHGGGNTVPTTWVADSVIAGSFQQPERANYDGKFFEDGGKLYLLYSKRLSDSPPADGIVAQEMTSPARPADSAPRTLLAPTLSNGGYSSEFFAKPAPDGFRMIETGNITKVGGKYVMAYSTGEYDTSDYKSGLAWSDTMIPAHGSYRKILMADSGGVWGKKGGTEVRYLLQAQKPQWPNYVASSVLAPGVPSVVESDGRWYLFFAGFLPSDAPKKSSGKYDPSHRRPFFMPLKVDVPGGTSVESASDAQLAAWITWA